MKVALLGVGQAGGKLAEALARYDARMEFGAVQGALAVNSARADLQSLQLDTLLVGGDRVNGHGVGGDNELGAEVMQADIGEVLDSLDGRVTSASEAIFVVAGLGGGTGSGGAPVLVHHLKRVYDIPVYALGILPGRDEGSLYQYNAGRSLKTLTREADSVLLVDNDAWHNADESVEEGFTAINDRIAERVGLLLAAGEVTEGVAESVVDSSEVINTLRAGGMAALGYASAESSEEAGENLNTITSVTRNALFTGTSVPGASESKTALLVIAGEPSRISRKGVEKSRKWLEEELGTMEVRGGDFPLDSKRLAALVLLGGIERSPRINEFFERAKEAGKRESTEERRAAKDALLSDEIDGLF
ncbi:tubulin/FtsZ family protein [Natronomonas sp. EA1]|uniref:tubulin/FtsZ family protein n=1 Tax=Natronomonas sp. EA1 TaxID=3421655 RepID=UPI003EBEE223